MAFKVSQKIIKSVNLNLIFNFRIRNELRHFSRTTKKVSDPSKRNCIIMGRKTYFGVPER